MAHLKFMMLIADLRDTIARSDGIYGLWDSAIPTGTEEMYQRGTALMREKRWAVFVTKAVDRFEAWYTNFGSREDYEAGYPLMTVHFNEMESFNPADPQAASPFTPGNIPPLDVLMVLHAYMLNPRDFLEDCLRNRHLWLWKAGFPWAAVESCTTDDLDFTPPPDAVDLFESQTGKKWNSQNEKDYKSIPCLCCGSPCHIPWTTAKQPGDFERPFEDGVGFADGNFRFQCSHCSFCLTHEILKLEKFRRDVKELVKSDIPMPGTVLPASGVHYHTAETQHTYVNHTLTALGLEKILEATNYIKDPGKSMDDVRTLIEGVYDDRHTRKLIANRSSMNERTRFFQRMSFRRMMGSYWNNHSLFKLDLVGAVLRQGTFIRKMDEIDWLHSPALEHTMTTSIQKYAVFLYIASDNVGRMAVPTLDVDLAWHTHQLSPLRYYKYCRSHARMLINHDDRVEEGSLSDGYEWTSKKFHELTGGQLYTACTCWYCEATRKASTSSISASLLKSSTSSKVFKNEEKLFLNHSDEANKMVHISAHNSISPVDREKKKFGAEMQHRKLIINFEKAVRRLRKRGIELDQPRPKKDAKDNKDQFLAWGILPKYEKFFAPYAIDFNISHKSSMYGNNPGCANFIKHAPGNCVSGTCAARVGAGACTNGEAVDVPYGGCTTIASAAVAETHQRAATSAASLGVLNTAFM